MIKKTALLLATFIYLHSLAQQTRQDTCKTKNCEYKVYYHPNGIKKEEGYLINGKKEGMWNEYAENDGLLLFKWTYSRNTKNGNYSYFNNEGKVSAFGKYKDGLLTDTLKYLDDKGILVKEEVWLANYKSKNSSLIFTKNHLQNAKPDNTIETINGKRYLWLNGYKHELISNDSINKLHEK